jgi:hypothetical protein
MIRWKPFSPIVTALLAILAGFYIQHRTNEKVAEARTFAVAAVRAWNDEVSRADSLETVAQAANARADSIEHARKIAAPARAAVVAAAPDTCAPAIAALEAERDQAIAEADARKVAFQGEKEAAAGLRTAGAAVADATTELAKASKPSFFARLIPKIGVGGAASISAIDRRPDAVIGITLSWEIH